MMLFTMLYRMPIKIRLQVRDGQMSSDALIGKYCGSRSSLNVKSSTNTMFIRLITDTTPNNLTGFTATVTTAAR